VQKQTQNLRAGSAKITRRAGAGRSHPEPNTIVIECQHNLILRRCHLPSGNGIVPVLVARVPGGTSCQGRTSHDDEYAET